MSALSWLMDLDFAGSPFGLMIPQNPGIVDSDLALSFALTDRPSRPRFLDGTDDPVELTRATQRAMAGRPLRPPEG